MPEEVKRLSIPEYLAMAMLMRDDLRERARQARKASKR